MEIARVDFHGVEPGGPGWQAARVTVTAAMAAYGFVVVAHDALAPELRRALFGRALPELFARVRMCRAVQVATNGRVPACLHRVRMPSNRERYTALFGRRQKDGVAVHALGDLVDAEHPLAFNPLRHVEYSKWRFSKEGGLKFEDPLKEYCGVGKDDDTAMA